MTILFVLRSLILSLTVAAQRQTFTRGQWNRWGSGGYAQVVTVSDGTLKSLDGSGTYTLTTIPSGQSVKDFGGGASGRSAWAAWAAGGVWDTTPNQFH